MNNAGANTQLAKLNFKGNALYSIYWTGTEESEDNAWSMYYYEVSGSGLENLRKRGPVISPLDKRSKAYVRCIREVYDK